MLTAEQPILPVGNMLEWYFQQPVNVQKKLLPLARQLTCTGETWQDKQRMARELHDAIVRHWRNLSDADSVLKGVVWPYVPREPAC